MKETKRSSGPSSGGRNGCPGLLWLQVAPSGHALLCSCGSNKGSFQRHCLLHPAPQHPSLHHGFRGRGGDRTDLLLQNRKEGAPVGGQRDGAIVTSRSWLDQTGPLVRLQPSMAESRSQQPPGKGAGPRSDLSHTHSHNAFTWVCSIDIPWCCASSANFRGSRCLFYSS